MKRAAIILLALAASVVHAQAPRADAVVTAQAAILCSNTEHFERVGKAWARGNATDALVMLEAYRAAGKCVELRKGSRVQLMNSNQYRGGADVVLVKTSDGALMWALSQQLRVVGALRGPLS